jgi:hypothetical protein
MATKVILEIDDLYTGVLSITAIASNALEMRVSTTAVNLLEYNHFKLGADGKWTTERGAEDGT